MPSRDVGFNRNILRSWLDAAGALAGEHADPAEIRARLDRVVGQTITSPENRRKAIDILMNVWVKSAHVGPALHREAIARFCESTQDSDRLWLHYGLAVLYYPFVRETAAAVGGLARHRDVVTPAAVKQRLVAERGPIGSLDKAVERILYSFRDWGVLAETERRYAYRPLRAVLSASSVGLEAWLLRCALRAHPAEELPFPDLLRLPELFPFRFSATVETLRALPDVEVHRQGAGWDTVRALVASAR